MKDEDVAREMMMQLCITPTFKSNSDELIATARSKLRRLIRLYTNTWMDLSPNFKTTVVVPPEARSLEYKTNSAGGRGPATGNGR